LCLTNEQLRNDGGDAQKLRSARRVSGSVDLFVMRSLLLLATLVAFLLAAVPSVVSKPQLDDDLLCSGELAGVEMPSCLLKQCVWSRAAYCALCGTPKCFREFRLGRCERRAGCIAHSLSSVVFLYNAVCEIVVERIEKGLAEVDNNAPLEVSKRMNTKKGVAKSECV
jgi:hypothetical protein